MERCLIHHHKSVEISVEESICNNRYKQPKITGNAQKGGLQVTSRLQMEAGSEFPVGKS